MRPLLVRASAPAVAAAVIPARLRDTGSVHSSALGWLIREGNTPQSARRVIPREPAAMIFLTGFRGRLELCRARLQAFAKDPALGMSALSLAAAVLTYSRSGILAAAPDPWASIAWRRWGVRGLLVALAAGSLAVVGAFLAGAIRSIPIEGGHGPH